MSDALARHVPQERSTTFGDMDGLVALLAETRHKRDGNGRDVAATVPTRARGPLVLTRAPELAPESGGGWIASELVRNIRRGPSDSLNLEYTSPLDLASLP
jgi:hypothetical protein